MASSDALCEGMLSHGFGGGASVIEAAAPARAWSKSDRGGRRCVLYDEGASAAAKVLQCVGGLALLSVVGKLLLPHTASRLATAPC